MTLFKELLKEIRKGKRGDYEFDFAKKIMKVKNRDWETDSNLIDSKDLENYYIQDLYKQPWEVAYMLFKIYYESNGYNKKYPIFPYKADEEKSADELAFGEDREFAEIQLEAYLMIMGKLGKLDFEKGFYYQHPIDKEFIVLKKWIYE